MVVGRKRKKRRVIGKQHDKSLMNKKDKELE